MLGWGELVVGVSKSESILGVLTVTVGNGRGGGGGSESALLRLEKEDIGSGTSVL